MGIGQWAMGIKDAQFLMRVLIKFFPCPMPNAPCPIPYSLPRDSECRHWCVWAKMLTICHNKDGEITSNENFGKKYASQSAASAFNGCYYVGTNCRKYHLE
jgi:hypothetical protein